ncbi:MAG: type II toxin-antitoxin system RelE/ParE family toxin [Marinobacter sp.]|nr:type II toxin-antitoxin system RelE/ParE family toxin [Marinobacter sp.]
MVIWTAHAQAQLRAIHDYIAQDSPLYAKRVAQELVHAAAPLKELPHIGRKVPELDQEAVREIGLYSYRIMYELKQNGQVSILAIIHKRRHIEPTQIPRTSPLEN